MKRVQSRVELKQKILLDLGHPYINVNLSDEHLDNCVDTALRHFFKYSYYGSFESHYIYTVGDADVAQGWIAMPRYIDAVIEVLWAGTSLTDLSFATAEYQMSRETFMAAQRFNNVSLVDYVTLKQRLYNTQSIINAPQGFEYSRYQRRVIPIFTYKTGDVLAFRVYENVDPEAADVGKDPTTVIPAADLWDDEDLRKLAVACAKKTWGGILKKFGSVVLPGGVTLDGQRIHDEGVQEFDAVTKNFLDSNPMDFFMG